MSVLFPPLLGPRTLFLFLFFLATVSAAVKPKSPHIVLLLVDDLGYHNTALTNPTVNSPNIVELLATSGRQLLRHYSYKVCSPSRSSLLSGRMPIHVNELNAPYVNSSLGGVDTRMTLLPEKLKEAGYNTAAFGKWHLGARQVANLPSQRGFDYHFGFLGGGEDHNTQHSYEAFDSIDLWGGSNDSPNKERNGTNSCLLYGGDAVDHINNRVDPSQPQFMYLALQNCHAAYVAPEIYKDKNITDYPKNNNNFDRQAMEAMMTCADEVVLNVTTALKERGMWDDTLIVFSSDNGGPQYWAANNYPFRGGKGNDFEGGVRVISFIAGGKNVLDPSLVNKPVKEKIHFADWFSTFSSLAGVDPDCSADGEDVPNIDSIDMSSILFGGEDSVVPRTVVPLSSNAIIVEDLNGIDWKLVTNSTIYQDTDTGFWTPNTWPTAENYFPQSPFPSIAPLNATVGYLFNLNDDPFESKDLALKFPKKAQELKDILDSYTIFQTGSDGYQDPRYLNCVTLEDKIEETGGWAAPVCTAPP